MLSRLRATLLEAASSTFRSQAATLHTLCSRCVPFQLTSFSTLGGPSFSMVHRARVIDLENALVHTWISAHLFLGLGTWWLQLLRDREPNIPPEQSLETAKQVKELYSYVCPDLVKEFAKYDKDPEKWVKRVRNVLTLPSHCI